MINSVVLNNFSKPNIMPNIQKMAQNSKVAFNGRIQNIPETALDATDFKTLAKPLEQNTFFFRDGLHASLNEITKRFFPTANPRDTLPEKPKKFFVYGCSDGHETYSIIMYLLKLFYPLEEVKKRVEIHSIDIPSPALDMAKSGKLCIADENLNKPMLRLIDIAKRPRKISKEIRKGILNINPDIFEYANFKQGRILDDFQPDGQFNEKEPVAVFFRNALPYIKPEIALPFIDNLYAKLPAGSFFCIGNHDYHHKAYEQLEKVLKVFKANPEAEDYLFEKPFER